MWSIPQYTDLTYMRGTGPCGPMTIIFGSVIWSQYTNLNIKFGPQFTDLTYMGGTGPCGPMTIIFDSVIESLHIKFGANRSFHVPKIPVWFGLYGWYQILWTDIAHF